MSASSSRDDGNHPSNDGGNNSNSRTPFDESEELLVVTVDDLDAEDAEGDVLLAVEDRHSSGRTPPLVDGGEATESKLFQALNTTSTSRRTPAVRFKEAGERVRRMTRLRTALLQKTKHQHHRSSSARNLLLDIHQGENEETQAILNNTRITITTTNHNHKEGDGLLMKGDTCSDHKPNPYAAPFDHHLLKATSSTCSSIKEYTNNNLNDQGSIKSDEQTMRAANFNRSQSAPLNFQSSENTLPLHHTSSMDHHHHHPNRFASTSEYNLTNPDGCLDAPSATTTKHDPRRQSTSSFTQPDSYYCCYSSTEPPPQRHHSYYFNLLTRHIREVGAMIHPFRLANNFHDILEQSFFLWVGFPCLLAGWFLFYFLGNPTPAFLPGQTASLAWWLLFATRQTVTLGLARLTVYVLVDGFMLGTRLSVQTIGPLLTLIAATSKGWPLILSTWGVYNLLLLHGDSPFQRNWLYWTHLEFFNLHYDGIMMNHSLYTRTLFSAILGGLAVSAKRTILALRFGRRQFQEFKPKLERILADVVLLSEIATLAEQVDKEVEEEEPEKLELRTSWDMMMVSSTRPKAEKKSLKEYLWAEEVGASTSAESHSLSTSTGTDTSSMNPNKAKRETSFALFDEYETACRPRTNDPQSNNAVLASPRQLRKSDSGRFKIKDMLDPWEEPDDKADKAEISIHDILKFRRALSHLDADYLFGEAFGGTTTRDECIASSHSVYYRLVKLAPREGEASEDADSTSSNTSVLPFDVLALLTLQEDGETENTAKKRMIRKIFTPDRSGALPLLAFIQAVDKIYKRLRFFRASIRNASVIDGVLERLVNGLFYCSLAFLITSLLQFNPWSLMVSFTTILVSVSFALGSSVSKYVEGVLLIAVRRPYDLGDRIFMASAESINPMPDVADNSWLVEDITLTTTTLRYTRTNEVSTVNNWSIAASRIVNCNRSPRATVHMQFTAHTSILELNKLERFQSAIKRYVEENPRVWDSVAHIRHDHFDADQERIDFTMALRHRSSWQDAGRIKLDRSNVYRFLFDIGQKMDIHFSTPPDQRITYSGGALKRGDNDEGYMRDLLSGNNLISGHSKVA